MTALLKGRAYRHIRQKLLSGELQAGMTLSPSALAREIQISHTPIREAIAQLESQGLVEVLPRIGPVVRRIERHDFEEIMDLREIVEVGAVRLASTNAGRKELEALGVLCDDFLKLAREVRSSGLTHYGGDLLRQMDGLDEAFHSAVIAAAKNRRLVRISEDLNLVSRVFDHARDEDFPGINLISRVALVYRCHARIVRALRRRDADAAERAVRLHLRWAKQLHMDLFDWRRKQEMVMR